VKFSHDLQNNTKNYELPHNPFSTHLQNEARILELTQLYSKHIFGVRCFATLITFGAYLLQMTFYYCTNEDNAKFIILRLQNWRKVINKLCLASVLFILISRKLFYLTNVAVASCGLGYREERSPLGGRPHAQWTTGRSDKEYWSDKLMIRIHEYGDTVTKYSFAVGVRMK
jgi:hypothetical protein